ncbi:MAG: triphosphoribosyl-dephospho-CoA synthase, partial [Methylocystis sp.]|nr:triphosphoribosyl-dephospho-CoA synthase [Methylocystis sp.]
MRARPAGLGVAPRHDVSQPAQTTLLEAMRAAADRDSVARQYDNGFADIFGPGFEALALARQKGLSAPWTTLSLYAVFLSNFEDSHIARKFGAPAAEATRREAAEFKARLDAAGTERGAFALALEFDAGLKRRGVNPGTSADLTVATLFADSLSAILASASKNG